MFRTILTFLSGRLTGCAEPRARRELAKWTGKNATLKNFRYGKFRRFLIAGTEHPILFAFFVGTCSAILACIVAGRCWSRPGWLHLPVLAGPDLDPKFDPAAFAGVPWSVEATLVAMVYPIVLSFIALLLQRKAHSAVALRVYVLDCAVVPAGASSIGLLLALSVQYFASPYSTSKFLAHNALFLLLFDGIWFAANVLLTGFFLGKTIRFIQEEEQQHAYTRVAVDIALRADLVSTLKEHIIVDAPYRDWGFAIPASDRTAKPEVHMVDGGRGSPSVKRRIRQQRVLHDVHLNLLRVVAALWARRASRHQSSGHGRQPTLYFTPIVGEVDTDEVVLCSVENGPALNLFERVLVRAAFSYRRSQPGTLSLTTTRMLEEIASGVTTAVEARRFETAAATLRDVFELHKTLLSASAVGGPENESLATIGVSPYGWGPSSFDVEWQKPYREISRMAVNVLAEDLSVFSTIGILPARIASQVSPKPEKLIIDTMLISMNLAYHLNKWWIRKADESLPHGPGRFSGFLPPQYGKPYEQALIAFIGGWGHLRVNIPKTDVATDEEIWSALGARTSVYARHIEHSAELLLKAVSRGDDAASEWFLDNYLKWWGNRGDELSFDEMERFSRPKFGLSLASKSWGEVAELLNDYEQVVTSDRAKSALNLALRRYWEAMRLYLILLLISKAGEAQGDHSRELRFAAALLMGEARKRGGRVESWELNSIDSVLKALLDAEFDDYGDMRRIDAFAERQRWDDEPPEVPGWIYGWSGGSTDFSSMRREACILLAALSASRTVRVPESTQRIESWWRDLEKLEVVATYCGDRYQQVLSDEFNTASSIFSALCAELGTAQTFKRARVAVARAMKTSRKVARHERLITLRSREVDQREIARLAENIAVASFGSDGWPLPLGTRLSFVTKATTDSLGYFVDVPKSQFIDASGERRNGEMAKAIGASITMKSVASALWWHLDAHAYAPTNSPAIRNNYQATAEETQELVSVIAKRCKELMAAGIEPVVIVGRSAVGSYLRPYRWGATRNQFALPPDIFLRPRDPDAGETGFAYINDVPIYELETPNADSYVIPRLDLSTLEVTGKDASSAIRANWEKLSDEQLRITINWNVAFQSSHGDCEIANVNG
ncbi:hypothetical protein [Paraburkholderia sp. C35]|uniref:hypothetical protein n=1 Tax=Paraburkholderia sp. C35 TaxID=2126993 RepID=UPI0013A54CAA|nr:hypothetical protein [Paraburkholderia sp. C35]